MEVKAHPGEGNGLSTPGIDSSTGVDRSSVVERYSEADRSWMDSFPDIIIAFTESNDLSYINPSGLNLLGYQTTELSEVDPARLIDQESLNEFIPYLQEADSKSFVTKLKKLDDTFCFVFWSSFQVKDCPWSFFSGKDITGVVSNQQTKIQKEYLFQALIDNSFDLLALTDEKGNYKFVSQSLTQLFGYEEEALLGKNCFEYMHPEDLPRILDQFRVLLFEDKKIQVPPYRFRNADGEWLWMEAIVTNQLNNPDLQGVVVSVRNITHQMEAEERIKEMHLLQALMEGEEKERSRIASDLHDGISGMIAAAKMHFTTLSSNIGHIVENKAYQQGMDLLEHASVQVRRTSHNLMPEVLLERGLAKALERYCTSVNNDSLQLVFLSVGSIQRYPAGFELALYRIAQELIGNIIRHSQATQALVQLSQQGNILHLSIEDNGIGFAFNNLIEGTGLASIKRRVAALQGNMEIDSSPGKGTQVYIEFDGN